MNEYEVHAECADGEMWRLRLKAYSMAYTVLAAIANFHAASPEGSLVRITVEQVKEEKR